MCERNNKAGNAGKSSSLPFVYKKSCDNSEFVLGVLISECETKLNLKSIHEDLDRASPDICKRKKKT